MFKDLAAVNVRSIFARSKTAPRWHKLQYRRSLKLQSNRFWSADNSVTWLSASESARKQLFEYDVRVKLIKQIDLESSQSMGTTSMDQLKAGAKRLTQAIAHGFARES